MFDDVSYLREDQFFKREFDRLRRTWQAEYGFSIYQARFSPCNDHS
jgi:hypothetical protein